MAVVYNTSIIKDQLYFHLDFANVKTYPGSGSTAFNLRRTGDFSLNNSPVIANNVASFSGIQNGPFLAENSSFGDQGTNSFTYQFLINPKSSTSTDDPASARVFEQTGFPTTYHILSVAHNSGNRFLNFFGRDTTQTVSFGVNSPAGSITLNTWYFVTTMLDRANNLAILYINDTRYTSSSGMSTLGAIGNSLPLRIPSSYAELQADISCIMGYRKALTDQEVLQNFNALRGRYGI